MDELLDAIGKKESDPERITDQLIRQPSLIPRLFEGLKDSRTRTKYGCEKLLRRLSEKRPDLIYPYFDAFAELLDGDNSFLKWGAIRTIANLAGVDSQNKIEAIFRSYYGLIGGPVMISAANVIGSSPAIAAAKPALAGRIAKEILKVETASYELKGEPSPECRNVAIGHALSALEEIFDRIRGKKPVLEFAQRQLRNPRPNVRKKAEQLLRKTATG